ncbi:MAG: PEP-CTERM sorting domain-containing protein [Planctomycetota bacterium]
MINRRAIQFALMLTVSASQASADLWQVTYSGVLTQVAPELSGAFAVNDPFVGVYTFDATTPDTNPFAGGGRYATLNHSLAIDTASGPYAASTTPASDFIIVENDLFGDRYSLAEGQAIGPSANGLPIQTFGFNLVDPAQGVFTSESLPTSLDLSAFASNGFTAGFNGTSVSPSLGGNLTSLSSAALPATPASAYFSLEGDFNAAGDEHNFTFDLSRSVTSSEVLRFETFANGGGTNAAGDIIASGGIDSDLRLRDSNNTVIGRNDDADTALDAFDSLLSWPGVAPAPRNPFIELTSPLVAGSYSLNLIEFNNDQAGPWAIDLVGAADAMTLTGAPATGTSTIDSLKFGTTGAGSSPAVYTEAGAIDLLGALVVGQSGNATLNVPTGGQVTVGGATTVNAGGTVNVSGGSLNANGGLNQAAGGDINLTNGGQLNSGGDRRMVDGTVTVTGASDGGAPSTWTHAGDLDIRERSDSTVLNITAGGRVDIQRASSSSSLQIEEGGVRVSGTDGNGLRSTLAIDRRLELRFFDPTMTIESGGLVSAPGVDIDAGVITVRGSDATGLRSTLNTSFSIWVSANDDDSTLNILNGAYVSSEDGVIASSAADDTATVNVNGFDAFNNPAEWAITDTLRVSRGSGSFRGVLNIGAGGKVSAGGSATIDGEVNVTGGELTIGGTTTVNANGVVNISGGMFDFGATTQAEYQAFNATGGKLVGAVSVGGVNTISGVTALLSFANVDTTGIAIANQGRLFGAGAYTGAVLNAANGELEVITGERMTIQGAGNTNAGQITLAGGQVEFTQGFTNQAGGLVLGFGGLRADGGTMNDGTMAFSATAAVIGDVTNNATGVISSSGGTTMFFDDVVNNGEIRTNANSFTVYFGSYSGNGDTGTGTVIMEGDLKPGSSPGLMAFGGDLVLGDQSTTEIELGGLTPGTQSDQITVVDELALDGDLTVSLLPGYTSTLGDTFDLLTAASISGVFDSITLPAASFELIYSATRVQLIATSALSGDYNNDGVVDAADYTVWRDNLNAPAGTLLNDDVGGVIGTAQYDAWRANFGATLPAISTAVPEPTCLALLGLGGLTLATRHRRLR